MASACLVAVLSACGGGGGEPASGGGGNSGEVSEQSVRSASGNLVVSPGQFNLLAFSDSGTYQFQELTITGTLVGDSIALGYPIGVSPVSWLMASQTQAGSVTGRNFSVPFTLNATAMNPGQYETFVRVAAGYAQGEVTGIVDLPVHLRVVTAPPVYTGQIALTGRLGQLGQVAQTIRPDFGAHVPDTVTATVASDTGDAGQWFSVDNQWRSGAITIKANPALPIGQYRASLNVNYTVRGATAFKAIPVTLDVRAGAPTVLQASPGYVVIQRDSVVVLRGLAFSQAQSISATLGGVAASQVTVVDDTELRLTFTSAPARGEYPLLVNFDGVVSTAGQVRVRPDIAYVLQDIQVPCASSVEDMVFDASRGNIIAICDNTYYLVSQVNGVWSVVRQRRIDNLGYGYWRSKNFLTPDSRYLMTTGDARIVMLDPLTLDTVEERAVPVIWYQSAGYGFLSLEAVLNDGRVLLTISGMPRFFYVYNLNNRTLTRTDQDSGSAFIVNASYSPLIQSRAHVVYVKTGNRPQVASTDAGLFDVTLFAAPDDWHADYAFPGTSPDGRKAPHYSYFNNVVFELYDTSAITLIGQIVNSQSYSAASIKFTESSDEFYVIDGGQGRFDLYGASLNDTALRHSVSFTPYSYYAAMPRPYLTPDHGAVILYGATNGNGVGATPPMKVLPIPR